MKIRNIKLLSIMIFIFTVGILCFATKSEANSISKISMDIYVDKNGNAQVTETWNCSTSKGTEVYHPYYNLGNSKITNLTVSEGSTTYTSLSSWDTSGSLNQKAYKCGINKISNGVELCWGISKYGNHTYVAKYQISNFVSELRDCQMIYWTLIPYSFSNAIGNVDIKIHSDDYIKDSIDVWGYGNYGGLCYVNSGNIYMSSDGRLDTDEYMTILVKFPPETFICENRIDKEFDHFYNMAEDGSVKYNGEEDDFLSEIFGMFMFIVMFVGPFIMIVIAAIFGTKAGIDFKINRSDRKEVKHATYFRDIPCNGKLYYAYYIAYQYGIIKNKTDLLGAIILTWLKKGIVRIEKVETGKVVRKEDTAVALIKEMREKIEIPEEQKLFDMMYEASGDGILEKKEFEKWCSGKYTRILNWFETVLKKSKEDLIRNGILIKEEKTTMGIFKNNKYTPTEEMKQYAIELSGLKKYLLDYTLIKDREAIEVTLFEDYLIYAQLMGIAKKVSKEFKNLYPDLIEESNFSSYDNVLFINYCSYSGISRANSARAAAQSYSSGGGGFSSGGGGGRFLWWRRRPEEVSVKI